MSQSHVCVFCMYRACMESFEADSCIWEFHIYKEKWTPVIGEQLKCTKEDGNPYGVAVIKAYPETVGYAPHCISVGVCSSFISWVGKISCTVNICIAPKSFQKTVRQKTCSKIVICKKTQTFLPQTNCNIQYEYVALI